MQNDMMQEINKFADISSKHIEEFACAFIKHTRIPPDKCVMVIKQSFSANGAIQEIYFKEKAEGEL